ncbi:hypothetical protein Lal_00047204 [Lupinus albus]|nr:hypothetical protein Lal_00047204 [Lupinus albus]
MTFTKCTLILAIICFILIQEYPRRSMFYLFIELIKVKYLYTTICIVLKSAAKDCKGICWCCCRKCNCVPSGLSGTNREECPCYAKMKSYEGPPKCP